MDELENPYRPGAGTEPPALTGRDTLLETFRVALRRTLTGRPGKSVMAIGLRGVGKTVLLNRFRERAEGEGFHVAAIEATDSGSFSRQLALRLRSILLGLDQGPVERAVRRALRVLKSFAVQLPDGSTVVLDVEAMPGSADSGDAAADISDVLIAIGTAAQARGAGVLIAIDEVQYLGAAELGAMITAVHATTQRDLPVMLVGAGLPQLPALAGEARSYAERLFEFPEIGRLAPEDAAAALAVPAEAAGIRYTTAALEAIVSASQGYPYFLQEWGYRVWNLAGASPIDAADVAAAAPRVQEHLDRNFFLVRFGRLTPREKEYLRAMARLGPGPHRSGDIAAALGVRVESVAPRRSNLIARGMIYSPAHGETAFTVPLFDEFLLRAVPEA